MVGAAHRRLTDGQGWAFSKRRNSVVMHWWLFWNERLVQACDTQQQAINGTPMPGHREDAVSRHCRNCLAVSTTARWTHERGEKAKRGRRG